ncbi:leucine rich repeat containing protein BspA family protein, partial [Entamoeba invadens IP1]
MVEIPFGVQVILNDAFKCAHIQEIAIPDSVTFLGDCVFNGCTNLTRVTLPSSLKYIPSQTFEKCVSLKEVKIPSTVTAIGYDCFGDDCGVLSIVVTPNICVSLNAFECSNLNHIEFVGQMYIADYVCGYCSLLKSVKMDTTVQGIGSHSFYQCEQLEYIDVPSSLQIINMSAFEKCTSLRKFVIPRGLLYMCARVFCDCSNLEELYFPENTKFSGVDVFTNCIKLSALTLPNFNGKLTFAISKYEEEMVNKFGYTALDVVIDIDYENEQNYNNDEDRIADEKLHEVKDMLNCDEVVLDKIEQCKVFDFREAESVSGQRFYYNKYLQTVYFPSTIVDFNLENISNSTDNPVEISENCCINMNREFSYDMTSNFVFPTSITKIGVHNIWYGVPRKYDVPSTVVEIGKNAFNGYCYLEELVIPKSVTKIGNGFVSGCSVLTSLVCENGTSFDLKKITESDTNTLHELTRDTTPTKLVIPNGVTYAYNCVSELADLKELFSLPSTLKKADKYLFSNNKKLTKIELNGVDSDIFVVSYECHLRLKALG